MINLDNCQRIIDLIALLLEKPLEFVFNSIQDKAFEEGDQEQGKKVG